MTQEAPDIASIRNIREALDVGSTEDGQHIMLNLRMADGATEWFAVHHPKVGQLVSGIMFASAAAARERPKVSPGGNQLPELSTVIDITGFAASAVPGQDFVVLRMVVGEGVNLDFRLPASALTAIQEELEGALRVAQSGKSTLAH